MGTKTTSDNQSTHRCEDNCYIPYSQVINEMESQIYSKVRPLPEQCEHGCWKRYQYPQKIQQRTYSNLNYSLAVLVVLFSLTSVMQFCWNAHLYSELNSFRQDIALLKSFHAKSKDFLADQFQTVTNEDDTQDESTWERPTHLIWEDSSNFTSAEDAESGMTRSLVKRDAGSSGGAKRRGRKGKKGQRKNEITKMFRKRKAVAVHIKARNDRQIGRLPNYDPPVSGVPLKTWQQPGSKYVGFDTTHLSSEGYISVKASGLYYVYSQVIFLLSDVPHMVAEIGVNTWGRTVFTKCQLSRPTPTANGAVGSSESQRQHAYAACHSSGVVYLTKGQGISLCVSPPTVEVFMQPEYTYFGAFLIGF